MKFFNFYFGALSQILTTISLLLSISITSSQSLWPNYSAEKCNDGNKLKYLSGDALTDHSNCIGPNGLPYPASTINRAFSGGSSRKGRQSQFPNTLDPMLMQSTLLNAYREANEEPVIGARNGE